MDVRRGVSELLPYISQSSGAPRLGSFPAASAPGLGSPLPHLRRDSALPVHFSVCAACGLVFGHLPAPVVPSARVRVRAGLRVDMQYNPAGRWIRLYGIEWRRDRQAVAHEEGAVLARTCRQVPDDHRLSLLPRPEPRPGGGLTPAASAPGLGSPLPHLVTPATSAPGLRTLPAPFPFCNGCARCDGSDEGTAGFVRTAPLPASCRRSSWKASTGPSSSGRAVPHLHQDWAHPATSAPLCILLCICAMGLGSTLPASAPLSSRVQQRSAAFTARA